MRLLVDGTVAGVVYPYATLYTGAFVPAIWRPIPSYGALDLPSYFLDLTHYAPLFADGKSHVVTIDVCSGEDDHAILQNWYVSGLLQVFLDPSGLPTTGNMTTNVEPYARSSQTGEKHANGDVSVTVWTNRNIQNEATVVSGSGVVTRVSFYQWLVYANFQTYSENGREQVSLPLDRLPADRHLSGLCG